VCKCVCVCECMCVSVCVSVYRGLGFSHLRNSSFLKFVYNIRFLSFEEFHISCKNSKIFENFHFEEFTQLKVL
jgi:hypothetical protein